MLTLPVHLLVPRAGGREVLGDEGGMLPIVTVEVEEGGTLVVAVRRALRAAWDLDAIVLETHAPLDPDERDDRVALAVLDAPPSAWRAPPRHAWARPPALLPERIGARAATWLEEWQTGTAPPALRPRWARPGWHSRATSWVHGALEEAGRPAAGEFEIRRLWGISATARIPTADGGTAWFKAVFPHFDHEVAITRFLEQVVPDAVPRIIAADEAAGWLLLDDVGAGPIGFEAADAQRAAAIRRLVEIQTTLAGREDELRAAGAADRPLRRLADDIASAMKDSAEIEAPEVPPNRLAEVVQWVRRQADWLAACGLPETVVHGDFHGLNVMERDGASVIIDWSDAAISHPLLEIGPWFGFSEATGDPDRDWDAWLNALSGLGPVDAFRGERDGVFALASAYQLVSYAHIVRDLEPANRYQLSDGVRDFWGFLDERVP